ncbi:TonB-dependent receptor [Steroidobacter sp. S1-65]|uniref:TonB-dependent receptor n=1 Tax=Steroidobacter gossypii TaxID=2805490 RepID=A0ABS1X5Z5_9GAMM|nr:TonB-dependent receptor [Steroidobacter gossypii]MBM0108652.1 TonB-dependent receptor [Steroidobacter gossypii]
MSAAVLVALLCASGISVADEATPPQIYTFNIPRSSLVSAIQQFSEQTGIQVTANFGSPEEQEQPVEEILGDFAARDALQRLLAGTKLTAKWEGNGTVHIYPRSSPRSWDGVNRVVVTGSRLTWDVEGPEPVRVYDRDEIDRYGVSSLPGLAGYLTQQPYSFGEWGQQSGAQHFQMRGLGVDTTLVLINGRRAPPSATSVTLNAFDLNTIPLTAVDRIEIMSDSASAIYGADAIGGVVNIIMKKDVPTPEVFFHYGDAEGGARERRAATSFGISGERFKSAFTIDYLERGMLVGAERELWNNQDFTRFGGRDWRVTTANPGNVYSLTGDLLGTDGELSLDSSRQTVSILPDLERLSVFGSGESSLGDGASLFGETLIVRSDVVAQGPSPFISQLVVPVDNPYNPFGQPVVVDYKLAGMKPLSYVTESELERFVLGVRGGLRSWDWELVLTNSNERVASAIYNEVDVTRIQAALDSTDPQSALNPFRVGPAGSVALLSSLVGDPQVAGSHSRAVQVGGFLRGQLFRTPGGVSEFVVGGEWRRDSVELDDSIHLVEQTDEIASGFVELKVPLVEGVSIKAALRGDYYDNAIDSVNPQYGLVWQPAQDLLVRAAYGTSFRPPSALELFSPGTEFFRRPVADPRRGDSVSLVGWGVGGNPDLENVSARSFTSGVVYRPNRRPGVQLGAHYWRVVMDDRIVTPRTSGIEKLEELGRVTRFAPTEADALAGWPGAIQSVDGSLVNYGRLETSGVDVDLSYRTASKRGQLQFALSATWVDEYASQDLGPVQRSDRVGIASLDGTIPEWRFVGSLIWEGKASGASTTATFTPSYWDADASGALNRRLPSRTIIDMQAWVEPGRLYESEALDGLRLTVGALNLLNEAVDFANVGGSLGHDISQGDLRQRFAYLRITKSF